MSIRSLLNQPVTIVHAASGSTGWDFGAAANRAATLGRLDQQATSEETDGYPASTPDAAVATWMLFLGPAETIGPFDRVEQGSSVFEVVGVPNAVYGRRGVHHMEVQLRSVTGGPPTDFSIAGAVVPTPT